MDRILVVDDDRKIRELLQQFLRYEGFAVEAAENAEAAHEMLLLSNYDLMIIDVMMPGINGLELTRKVKAEKNIPILMLTAMGDTEDRIAGLESGADDYLPKPFEPRELFLRAKKLIDRFKTGVGSVASDRKIIKFGNCEFDMENFVLMKAGDRVLLSSSEAELLAIFCNNINVSIDRFDLAKKFHGISERSVDVQVTRLRKKIEDDPKAPVFIQTSRGKGYVFRV